MTAISDFTGDGSMQDILGPLNKETYQIGAGAMMRATPLLAALLDLGCRSCVVFPSKLMSAVKRSVTSPSAVKGTTIEKFSSDVTDHIMCLFRMLRDLKKEALGLGGPSVSRKTASFKKKMTASDNIVIRSLLAKVDLAIDTFPSTPTKDNSGGGVTNPANRRERLDDLASLFMAFNDSTPFSVFSIGNNILDRIEDSCDDRGSMASLSGFEDSCDDPALLETPPRPPVTLPKDIVFSTPLDPKPKRRKGSALAVRVSCKAKAKLYETARVNKVVNSEPLYKAVLTGPTKEAQPRVQLTAYTEKGVRVHVVTASVPSWGESARADLEQIKAKIDSENWSKDQCLELKDQLRKTI